MPDGARLEVLTGEPATGKAAVWKSAAWMEVTEERGALVLDVCGVLDAASISAIAPYLMAGVVSAPRVTLDLRKLASCDARGLALLDEAVERAQAAGTRIRITNFEPDRRRAVGSAAHGRLFGRVE